SLPAPLSLYLCTLVCVALPGALIPAMLYAFGRRRGVDARWSATVAATIAFSTLLLPYATIFMVAAPSGALMLYAYTSERRAAAGFAAGLAAAMNYLCIAAVVRSEEHTSELQSPYDLVCRLLLEKKKKEQEVDFTDMT